MTFAIDGTANDVSETQATVCAAVRINENDRYNDDGGHSQKC